MSEHEDHEGADAVDAIASEFGERVIEAGPAPWTTIAARHRRPVDAPSVHSLLSASAFFVLIAAGVPLLAQVPAWADASDRGSTRREEVVFDTQALRGAITSEEILAEEARMPVEAPPELVFQELAPEDAYQANLQVRPATLPNPAARPFVLKALSVADERRALECLTEAVYYEAASEGAHGMAAVAQVVLNRTRHPTYPKSVCGVVYQGSQRKTGCQFTFTCDGSLERPRSPAAWRRAEDVARAALEGRVMPEVGNATHYHTVWVAPYWSPSLTKVTTIGQHIFYRWQGRAGRPGAFTGRYAGAEAAPVPPAVVEDAPMQLALATEPPAELVPAVAPVPAPVEPAPAATEAVSATVPAQIAPVAKAEAAPPPVVLAAKARPAGAGRDWFGNARAGSRTRVATPAHW